MVSSGSSRSLVGSLLWIGGTGRSWQCGAEMVVRGKVASKNRKRETLKEGSK